jgi:hypothetical protein
MGAKSNNKYDVFEWIKRTIDSIEDSQQYLTSDRLIKNFNNLYADFDLTMELQWYLIKNFK